MKKTIFMLLLLLLGGAGRTQAQMRVLTDTLQSRVLGAPRAYTVLLPGSFDHAPERTYPVLYLLHGMWGKNDDWVRQGNLQDIVELLTGSGEACEMVIVTPDAGGGDPEVFQNGYFDMEGWAYETFFFQELLPEVERRYRVIGDKQHRAIAGLSMGGGGATAYAQHHTGLFAAAYAMSALMHIPEGDERRNQHNPDGKLAKLTRSVIARSCVTYVREADESRRAELRSVAWFVDCGDEDFLLDRNIEFYQAMRQQRISCQLRVRDGVHNWEYWRTALYQCLPFVSRQFNR